MGVHFGGGVMWVFACTSVGAGFHCGGLWVGRCMVGGWGLRVEVEGFGKQLRARPTEGGAC